MSIDTKAESMSVYKKLPIPKPSHTRAKKQPKRAPGATKRVQSVREYLDAHAGCEVQIALLDKHGEIMVINPCPSTSDEVHHLIGRQMGGSDDPNIHSDENYLCICRYHHRLVTENRV